MLPGAGGAMANFYPACNISFLGQLCPAVQLIHHLCCHVQCHHRHAPLCQLLYWIQVPQFEEMAGIYYEPRCIFKHFPSSPVIVAIITHCRWKILIFHIFDDVNVLRGARGQGGVRAWNCCKPQKAGGCPPPISDRMPPCCKYFHPKLDIFPQLIVHISTRMFNNISQQKLLQEIFKKVWHYWMDK